MDRIPQGYGFFVFMKIRVNGELFESMCEGTISDLFYQLKVDSVRVAAVEVNRCIIRRTHFAKFKIKDGDEIEIVNFVGGG